MQETEKSHRVQEALKLLKRHNIGANRGDGQEDSIRIRDVAIVFVALGNSE